MKNGKQLIYVYGKMLVGIKKYFNYDCNGNVYRGKVFLRDIVLGIVFSAFI